MMRLLMGVVLCAAGLANAAPTDGYVNCAAEGQMCAVATPGVIIYGAGSSYTAPVRLAPPGILCSNAIAGDPINGTVKTCWFRSDTAGPVVPPAAPLNPCTGLPAVAPIKYYDDIKSASGQAMCQPILSMTSTIPRIEFNGAGVLGYNFCKIGGKWKRQLRVATWDFLTGHNMAANAWAAMQSPDPLTAFQQLDQANVNLPLSDPSLTAVWCPFDKVMWANKPADDVVAGPAVWRTPNATTLKLYTASGGALTGQIAGRFAPANAACDSSGAPAKSGSSVYYPIAGASAAEFALCKQVQQ